MTFLRTLFTATATVAVLTLAGCGTITPTVPATTTSEAVQLTPTNTPDPTSTATPEPAQTSVTMLLESLTVAPETNESSYDRDRFNHWVTQPDGCDTRDAVLVRDGQNVTITSDCEVTGTWYSIYDGVTVTDPSDLDIDHMVPLKEAWVSGAYSWTDETRELYANDLTNPVALVAVTAGSNRSKGDRDPAEWMPTVMGGCEYVTQWVKVKADWNLTVDQAEKDSILSILSWCE